MTDAEYIQIVESHRPDMVRLARWRLRLFKMSPDDAEDYVQDALARMWENREHVTGPELEVYFNINLLQLISNARKRKVRYIDPTVEALTAFTPATAEQAERYADDVEMALEGIEDETTRTGAWLVYSCEFTVAEAAKLLKLGESALRMRLHRALPGLREQLAGYATAPA